jgi:hypothetical protein
MVCEGMQTTTRLLPQFRPTPAEQDQPLSTGQDLHITFHLQVGFPTRNPEEHLQADAVLDSGNLVPGSAVMSETLIMRMGVQDLLIPTDIRIMTSSEDEQSLQVIGTLQHLYMAVGHTLILHLHQITMVRNLLHPLNLGRFFMLEFGTCLCSYMQAPCLAVQGEFFPLCSVPPT